MAGLKQCSSPLPLKTGLRRAPSAAGARTSTTQTVPGLPHLEVYTLPLIEEDTEGEISTCTTTWTVPQPPVLLDRDWHFITAFYSGLISEHDTLLALFQAFVQPLGVTRIRNNDILQDTILVQKLCGVQPKSVH